MKTLENVLDEVGNAARLANISQLGNLARRLEEALLNIEHLGPKALSPAHLQRLKTKAEQNALLLDAALRGTRAARRRIEDVRQAAKGLQTYDNRGQRAEISIGITTAGRF